MNKVYTIGRDPSCDIVIADSTDVVSRVHASLKVKGTGKYVLIDQSKNGTYVNGIRMSPNEEIPVTRKDVVSLAHVRNLDWDQIPKEKNKILIWILSLVALIAVGCICYFIFKPQNEPIQSIEEEKEIPEETSIAPVAKDTTVKEIIYVKPATATKPKTTKEKPVEKKEEKPAEEEPTVVNPLL